MSEQQTVLVRERALKLRKRAQYMGLLKRMSKQALAANRPERMQRSNDIARQCERLNKLEREIGKQTDIVPFFQPHPKMRRLVDLPEAATAV